MSFWLLSNGKSHVWVFRLLSNGKIHMWVFRLLSNGKIHMWVFRLLSNEKTHTWIFPLLNHSKFLWFIIAQSYNIVAGTSLVETSKLLITCDKKNHAWPSATCDFFSSLVISNFDVSTCEVPATIYLGCPKYFIWKLMIYIFQNKI